MAILAGCGDRPVTSGTISGYGFTVVDGILYQDEEDGPVYAPEGRAIILLDDDVTEIEVVESAEVQLRIRYTLSDGGQLDTRVFASAESESTSGLFLNLQRNGSDLEYQMGSGVVSDAEGAFETPPADPDADDWIVAEFYNESTPGWGAVSGVNLWPINEPDPQPCAEEDQAIPIDAPPGSSIVFGLDDGILHEITFIDTAVGACD
jgi:hypothetical protein